MGFFPTQVLLHVGHNSQAFHEFHNPKPKYNSVVSSEINDLVDCVNCELPDARCLVSLMFPRCSQLSDQTYFSDNGLICQDHFDQVYSAIQMI